MKSKEYKLKTVEDITNVITKDNLDNFLIDFKSWLSLRIGFKEVKELENAVQFDNSQFRWIDDNKHNATINIKVKQK
jgi:hypothetical protein